MFGRLIARASNLIEIQGAWKGAGWGLATAALIDGVTFTIFGNAVAPGPSFSLIRQFPAGMRILGILMTAVGIYLLCTIHRRDVWAQRGLVGMFALGSLITCYTVGGWINAQQVSIGAFSKWLLLAWLGLWLAATTMSRRRGGGPQNVHSR